MAYPSIWLAGLYDGKKYYGQSISAIKKEIKAVIKDVMRRIASEHNLSQGNMGAKQLISLLDYMDDSILEYENAEIPERVPSDDDIDTLVNIAIGSPAVCLYRNLKEIVDLEERKKIARECCDKSFVSMFNRPEWRNYFLICLHTVEIRRNKPCSGNDECKSSLNYRMCLCDTNLKFGEHGPLWIWSLDLYIEK